VQPCGAGKGAASRRAHARGQDVAQEKGKMFKLTLSGHFHPRARWQLLRCGLGGFMGFAG